MKGSARSLHIRLVLSFLFDAEAEATFPEATSPEATLPEGLAEISGKMCSASEGKGELIVYRPSKRCRFGFFSRVLMKI